MPRAAISREETGRVDATIAFGGDVSGAVARDATGRVAATITVSGAGDRP